MALTAFFTAGVLIAVPSVADAKGGAGGAAKGGGKCAPAKHPGGDWRTYGHDDFNSRSQPEERVIGPGNAGDLEPEWVFEVAKAGGAGDIAGTPVVRFGCVYVGTAGEGWIYAFNADNGKLVWKRQLPDRGFVYGSLGVTRKRIFVGVQRTLQGLTGCPNDDPCLGPFMAAYRRSDGKRLWVSRPIDEQRGSETYGTPVIVDGVVMLGVSGGIAELSSEEDRNNFQGSMVFLDAKSGRILRKTYTIHPPGKPDDDFAGGGIWGTPAIDRRAKVAWVGTANPYIPAAAHPRAGAVLKLDIDRKSKTFGKILAFGEGTPEEYLDAFTALPCIDFPGNVPPYPTGLGSCFDLDLDIGASPNLFRGPGGRKLIGAGQKSGVYHVFDANSLEHLRETAVGPPSYFGGIVGSTAFDGRHVYGPITIPGYLWSVDGYSGALRWAYPLADVLHWGPPVAVANGVVYSVDYLGFLNGVDARTGLPVLKAPMRIDPEGFMGEGSWGGVAVARNKVYAAIGTGSPDNGAVIAFGLPE